MDFKLPYDRQAWLAFLDGSLLPDDFFQSAEDVPLEFEHPHITAAVKIGESPSLDLPVYEVHHESENDPRVSLSKGAFRLLARYGRRQALILFVSANFPNYRLSLVTIDLVLEGKRVKKEYSNPRRYSFFLGPDAKTHTPEQFLVGKPRVADFDDLRQRFSVEVVNKEFYTEIALLFTKLTGGTRKVKSKTIDEGEGCLKLPDTNDETIKKEFAVRLIGRLVFCWFLKKKHSANNVSLVPEAILSLAAASATANYYHYVLEPLFFETLNKKREERDKQYRGNGWDTIPFLNGGLFTPHEDDYYGKDADERAQFLNALKVPDDWLRSLLGIFEMYNFTIDESTSIDVELSIDPEMLGRIFENLLAEINPETGETARKTTGSYYTPRPIVDYMVNESLKQYLLTKTGICEAKIDSLLDYSKDARDIKLSDTQAEVITTALHEIRILDPACGSGAFPMGILQKILLILQKLDPDSTLWLERLLSGIGDTMYQQELKRKVSQPNYLHKLGIIRDCIFGVDIQPVAVEIAKLRCFLSLIVDEAADDGQPNRGIEHLPNLEFKFVCANSLIGLPKTVLTSTTKGKQDYSGQSTMFEAMDDIARLRALRTEYLNSFGPEKSRIESEFRKVQSSMFKHAIEWGGRHTQTLHLAHWDPFSHQPNPWFDPEWMFGVSGGFDVVIGNPPYLESRSPQFTSHMKSNFTQAFACRWPAHDPLPRGSDLLVYFVELSIALLRDNGHVVLIVQNSWLDTEYGKKLQEFLLSTAEIQAVVDSDYKYFDSKSGPNINTVILLLTRRTAPRPHNVRFVRYHETFERAPLSLSATVKSFRTQTLQCQVYSSQAKSLSTLKWGILLAADPAVLEVLAILNDKGRLYSEVPGIELSIGQGLNLTGAYFTSLDYISGSPLFKQAAIPIMTAQDGAVFDLTSTAQYLLDANKLDPEHMKRLITDGIQPFDPSVTSKDRPLLILPRGVSRHFCTFNRAAAFSSSYVDVYATRGAAHDDIIWNLWLFLNSSILWLFREIGGRKNLGGGLLKAEAVDLKSFPIYLDLRQTETIRRVFVALAKREALPTLAEIATDDHREIDRLVFDHLALTDVQRQTILNALSEAVSARATKSQT